MTEVLLLSVVLFYGLTKSNLFRFCRKKVAISMDFDTFTVCFAVEDVNSHLIF